MPNLLPNWLPWIHPAGRLIWGVLALIFGLMFAVTLMKRPLVKRPFPDRVGYLGFPAILFVGILAARFLTPVQTLMVWATALALIGHGLLMVASSKGRDPEDPATWAECFAGAIGVFALFIVAYAIVPSEWLNYANSYLQWGDTSKFVWTSHEQMLFFPVNWPFNLDFPSLRDIATVMIYGAVLTTNLKLFVMWQKRHLVKETAVADDSTPARRSRFGRPIRVKA